MKNKRWRVIMMGMLVAFSGMVFGACSVGKELAEEVVLEVVKSELIDALSSEETLDEIELLDRVTDKENKLDELLYKVITNDGETEYEKYYSARYDLVDNEWIMDDVEAVDKDKWEQTPLKGVGENNVLSDMAGEMLMIDGEVWEITKDNVSSLTVVNHETNLEKKRDSITVQFTINDMIEQAIGQVTVEYAFGNAWRKDAVIAGEFTVSTKPNFELKISEKDLLEELENQEISAFSKQVIEIAESEISDFVIESQNAMYKGCVQKYECSCILTKPNAVLNLQIEFIYEYRDSQGWVMSETNTDAQIVSLDIVGEWKGIYNAIGVDGVMVLNIMDLTEDGTIVGTYSYEPEWTDGWSSAPGSYKLSGWIDMSTLQIELLAGDWILKDTADEYAKESVSARFYVDSQKISGTGHEGSSFTAKRY